MPQEPREKASTYKSSLAERSAARLAAVQALYQMDISGAGLTNIFTEYEMFWIGQEVEGIEFKPADMAFFRDILNGTVSEQRVIDPLINSSLTPNWPLIRVMPVLRAIMRAGVYELMKHSEIPARVIISEYVEVAQSFYSDDEPGLVNAVLDKVARTIRSGELEKRKK